MSLIITFYLRCKFRPFSQKNYSKKTKNSVRLIIKIYDKSLYKYYMVYLCRHIS